MRKVRSVKSEGRSVIPEVRMPDLGAGPEDRVAERVRRRVEKWDAKYTPERVAGILAAKSNQMRENYQVQAEIQERVDDAVAKVTDAAGVPVMTRFWYKGFGREVCKVWRVVPSSCQETEYDSLRYKWTARGLDPILLARVRAAVVRLLESAGFPRKNERPQNQVVN